MSLIRSTLKPSLKGRPHSVNSLDNIFVGVGLARKGWLRSEDVLNTRSAKEVLAFASRKRAK